MEDLPCDITDIDSLTEYFKTDGDLNDKIYKITGIDSTTSTNWGSCSYSTIKAMHDVLNLLHNHYESTDTIYKLLNFDVKKIKSRKLEQNHVKDILKNYKENISESVASDLDDANIETIQECMQFMKNNDEDLWDTIGYIFNTIFPKNEINNIPDAIDRSGQEIQKQNNVIGFKCFHLVANNYIQEDDIFHNFPI